MSTKVKTFLKITLDAIISGVITGIMVIIVLKIKG